MTDRTCLDVAADAYTTRFVIPPDDIVADMRAALDAIHPALADLTPDDVKAIFRFAVWCNTPCEGPIDPPPFPPHAWEVLSRD